jgi:hypothetical protein
VPSHSTQPHDLGLAADGRQVERQYAVGPRSVRIGARAQRQSDGRDVALHDGVDEILAHAWIFLAGSPGG